MMEDVRKIVFLDVETPNLSNDRICSIGIVRTEPDGHVCDSAYYLIDPEVEFNARNIQINGITPQSVSYSPNFLDVWNDSLADLFEGASLVAHNASFDLAVITKTMLAYGVGIQPVTYACTMKIARAYRPGLPNYRLETLCDATDVKLVDHHNSLADARACSEVFHALDLRYHFVGSGTCWQEYSPSIRHASSPKTSRRISADTMDMRSLFRILETVSQDNRISDDEADTVVEWMDSHRNLEHDETFSRLFVLMMRVVEDGVISSDEEWEMLREFKMVVDPDGCGMVSEVSFEGKTFCLSGDFKIGSKGDIANTIGALGGTCVNSVSKKCDYVVVGNLGSERYSFGNYGTKVKKALELRNNGVHIEIIGEGNLGL
jgi:DNA polymerase-3 subunit epsilon